ncbi:MAG: endolytic transglycosylase MltG [Gammaproteobacteria bacterium]|nr:endolytic transglycosylase MltG [Gammaproteobacteria bacterium]
MRWLIAGVVLLTGVLGWTAYTSWQTYLTTPIPLESDVHYDVQAGTSLGAVALDLHARDWLTRPRWFVWYARSRGDEARIRAGEYSISAGITPAGLLALLVSGEVIQHSFTIIEGFTFADVRDSLKADPLITHTFDDLSNEAVMDELGLSDEHPEGRFLPETYYYTRGASDRELLLRAHELMTQTLTRLWGERDPDTLLKTPYEALILASIIEKETALDSERPEISGVFSRRLKKAMRLQSDPTVIYGIGPGYDGNIRKHDLTTDTTYNTYTRKGLTPTPIAMPGEASIYAALHPKPGSALYFVATGDPDGSHYFSDTVGEHNKAVQRYLARLRAKP